MNNLNVQFDSLQPKAIVNHIQELTSTEVINHKSILNELKELLFEIDYEALAFPDIIAIKNKLKAVGKESEAEAELRKQLEKFKLTEKHFLVITIDNLLECATVHDWGMCKQHGTIYLFNGCYWSEVDKELFEKFLSEAAEKMGVGKFTAKHFTFQDKLFKQFNATAYLQKPEPESNKVLINLQNGTFEVSGKNSILRPFKQTDFLTYQLPFKYNPEAKAPMFQAYLDKVLPDVTKQKVLAEYLGYVFMKQGNESLKLEKALILYGSGANGKSVFYEIVNALLGSQNISSYSLENLTNENGYYRAKIGNKLVNYASEINGKLESSIFKQLVSGEPVGARLPYGEPFELKDYAKLIFNCNELPKDVEHTNAYFRRFFIIPFDVTISAKERDTQLSNKIIKEELSGVFNWVLDGLNRLLEQKNFTECEAANTILNEYRTQSDSVQMFLNENEFIPTSTEYVLIKELYILYRAYCIEDGCKPLNKTNFIKRLKSINIVVDRNNRGNIAYLKSDLVLRDV